MTADAASAVALARPVARVENAGNLVAARATNDAVHAVIKAKEVARAAMSAGPNGEMIAVDLPNAAKFHRPCRKSMWHSCLMKKVSNPWHGRSR